jgi:hypothetical protein
LHPEQLVYAAKDVAILRPLAERLRKDKSNLLQAAAIEHRCLLALAGMELAGLPIEREHWLTRAAEETHRAQALPAQLSALLGRPQPNGTVLHLSAEPSINWNSPEQVLTVFHFRGHALDNTTSQSLIALLGSEPLAEVLLDYREAKKRAGTYGTAWLTDHLHAVTGRVHVDYVQLGAASGRMSCTHPNGQNLPRNGSYRRAVCPGEECAIVKADFSPIELRIAAVLADEHPDALPEAGASLARSATDAGCEGSRMTDWGIPSLREDKLSTSIPTSTYAGGTVSDPAYTLFIWRTAALSTARGYVIGFYTDDVRFEALWRNPRQYIDLFLRHGIAALIEPDFSLWVDAPLVEQLWAIYRMRTLGRLWQEAGLSVIPNLAWSHARSFPFCFEGIPVGAPVVACEARTPGSHDEDRRAFLKGLEQAVKEVQLKNVLIQGARNTNTG